VLVLGPVAKMMRRPVIFDPLVTLTDTIVEDRRIVSPDSPLAWALAQFDRIALRLADVVVTDTENNATYVIERFDIPAARIVVEPVGADECVFFPNPNVDWSDATSQRPLDVLFYGKYIPLHGIETILRAAKIVEERGIPIRVELVGTGQTYSVMRDLADQLKVNTIAWTDWLPELELAERLRQADVALGVFSGGAKAGRVVPNKVYQSLASRVATVTRSAPPCGTASVGGDTLLHDGESALLVPPDDPDALANAIERLCDGVTRHRIACGGYEAYQRGANAAARARVMTEVCERVMGDRWRHQSAIG
jgi:glycosyltransferase involved in cell wall biosynthesis